MIPALGEAEIGESKFESAPGDVAILSQSKLQKRGQHESPSFNSQYCKTKQNKKTS